VNPTLRSTTLVRGKAARGSGARGFTMIELLIAAALFLIVASVLALALVSDLGNRGEADVRRVLGADLAAGAANLAGGSYDTLLANTFTPPSVCSGSGGGTTQQSCYQVGSTTYRVTWSISSSSGSSTTLVVAGTVILPSGGVLTASHLALAPTEAYVAGKGVVRVRVVGSPSGWNGVGPVYLVEQNNPSISVASGGVSNGVAVLVGSPASCTVLNPCALGLSTGTTFASNGAVTEIPSDVWGTGSQIVLTSGGLTDATATITGIGTATLNLTSTNTSTGLSGFNSVAGSACIYLNFNDGVAAQSTPVCNFSAAGALSLSTYAPDPANPTTRVPFPIGTMSFSTDAANGSCPYVANPTPPGPVGSQGLTASGWTKEAVCTSWTWGTPASVTISGTTSNWTGSNITLVGGSTLVGSINWSGTGLGASIFVADGGNNTVRLISPGGNVTTWAGTGTLGLVNGPRGSAEFDAPGAVVVARDGTLYVADTGNNVIRTITPGGSVSTLATGFNQPGALALVGATLYVVDTGHNQIDTVNTSTGAVSVLAGNGTPGLVNGAGASAEFFQPGGVSVSGGVVYVADTFNNVIRAIAPDGTVSTFAGSGSVGSANGTGALASFSNPNGMAVDSSGNLYVSDQANNKIREITPGASVTTFAGNGTAGLVNGTSGSAEFTTPSQLSFGLGGGLLVADQGDNVVRLISGGSVSTLAGTGAPGYRNGTDPNAQFYVNGGVSSGLGWLAGQPAIGFGTVAVWSGPRLVQSCSTSGTCTSVTNTVPENTDCPGQDCYSGSAPKSAGMLLFSRGTTRKVSL
jgi:prepilin-type N-terminal cleavage/methylation domain-containing protein